MSNYKTTDILPPGRRRLVRHFGETTDVLPETPEKRQQLGGFATTSIVPQDVQSAETATYKVVLTDRNGFEEVIIENVETRNEAYQAYKAWFIEYYSDPTVRSYPEGTWAECYRGDQLSWKTNPFISTGRA